MNIYQYIQQRDKNAILNAFSHRHHHIYWKPNNIKKTDVMAPLTLDDWIFLEKNVFNDTSESFDVARHHFYVDIFEHPCYRHKLSLDDFQSWIDNIHDVMFWCAFGNSPLNRQYPRLWAGLNDEYKEKMLRIFLRLTTVTDHQARCVDTLLGHVEKKSEHYYYEHILAHILSCDEDTRKSTLSLYARDTHDVSDDIFGYWDNSHSLNEDDFDDDLNDCDFNETKAEQLADWEDLQENLSLFKPLSDVLCEYLLTTYKYEKALTRPLASYQKTLQNRLNTLDHNLDPQFKDEWPILRDMCGQHITLEQWFQIRFNKVCHVEQEIPIIIS